MNNFSQINVWIFDLDNTLYPRSCDLFTQIDVLITNYVMNITGLDRKRARKLQKDYYRDHGTTLNGLMHDFGIDPNHYLDEVHKIDYSPVEKNEELIEIISSLNGRKYIFTNADINHTEAVLDKLGANNLFDGLFDIKRSGFRPKPDPKAYEKFISDFEINVTTSIMFDDLEKNLKTASEMGMRTVHVVPDEGYSHSQVENWEIFRADEQKHINHITSNLAKFLAQFSF